MPLVTGLQRRPKMRYWLVASGLVSLTCLLLYLYVIYRESRGTENYEYGRSFIIGALLAVPFLCVVAASLTRSAWVQALLLSTAATLMTALGMLALMSIGVGLLIAAAPLWAATGTALLERNASPVAPLGGAGAALLLTAGSLWLAQGDPVHCLPNGGVEVDSSSLTGWGASSGAGSAQLSSGGATTGTLTGGGRTFHFTCSRGRLVELSRR
jgi:hypothetical protein